MFFNDIIFAVFDEQSCYIVDSIFMQSILIIILFFHFSSQIRNTLSDFAIFFGIVICTCVDVILAVDTPKLTVPDKIKVQKQRKILITFLIYQQTTGKLHVSSQTNHMDFKKQNIFFSDQR